MKITRRSFLQVCGAAGFAAALSACGAASSTASSAAASSVAASSAAEGLTLSTDPVTIGFCWWGGDSRHEATQNAVAAFMAKYTNITVENTFGAWTDWETSVSQQIYAGTAPDVMQINWNWISSYSADGSGFYDLNQAANILDLTQFPEDKLAMCQLDDGNQQCVPVSMTGRIFYWDKTTFDELGVALPTSQADLTAAGAAFKAKGDKYYPLVVGEYDRMVLMVYYLESKYGKNWVENGAVNYTEEEVKDGLDWLTQLETDHVIPTLEKLKGDGADSIDKNQNWIEGYYAGIFEWDSSASKMSKAAEGREIVVGDYFKDWGTYQGGFSKVSMGFAVSAKSQHPAEAALLINYLLNDPEGIEIMASERGIPCSTVGLSTCTEKGLLNEMVAEANGKVMAWTQFQLDPKFESGDLKTNETGLYYVVLGGLSYGQMDSAEAAKELIDGVNAVLQA